MFCAHEALPALNKIILNGTQRIEIEKGLLRNFYGIVTPSPFFSSQNVIHMIRTIYDLTINEIVLLARERSRDYEIVYKKEF